MRLAEEAAMVNKCVIRACSCEYWFKLYNESVQLCTLGQKLRKQDIADVNKFGLFCNSIEFETGTK